MSLFIESQQRAAARAERLARAEHERLQASQRAVGRAGVRADFDLDEAPGFDAPHAPAAKPGPACKEGLVRPVALEGEAAREQKDAGRAPKKPAESYSLAGESYREALAFDERRARGRTLARVARVLALIVLVPLLLLFIFVGSYALSCVVSGATPSELMQLLGELFSKMGEFAMQAVQQLSWASRP